MRYIHNEDLFRSSFSDGSRALAPLTPTQRAALNIPLPPAALLARKVRSPLPNYRSVAPAEEMGYSVEAGEVSELPRELAADGNEDSGRVDLARILNIQDISQRSPVPDLYRSKQQNLMQIAMRGEHLCWANLSKYSINSSILYGLS